jgi:GT2 family glycosyltransferase
MKRNALQIGNIEYRLLLRILMVTPWRKKMKFSFVILHYQVYQETVECIQSIFDNIQYEHYSIVVVDNGSINDSGEKLEEHYRDHEKVTVLLNKENLGFAKGNNVGFRYAKNNLDADFIVMINNDTLIKQETFLTKILDKHKETNFNILGPDILSTKDGLHQNPLRLHPLKDEEIKSAIFKYGILQKLNVLGIERIMVQTFGFLKRKIKKTDLSTEKVYKMNNHWEKEQEGVILHGACLIFDPKYVERFNGIYDNTFMYMEEDILSYIAEKEELKVIYAPDIQILHKEDSSTDAVYNKEDKKRLFVYKHSRKSLQELLKVKYNGDYYKKYIEDQK